MLLRRIISHVQEQNWTAIVLDFLIVVSGVFIGIQVANWNDGRLAMQSEQGALERLQREAEEIVAYFKEEVADRKEANLDRVHALQALTAGTLEGFDRERVEDGLFSIGYYRAMSPKRSTYDELTASGQFGKISDAGVRESVAAYYAEYEFIQSQLQFFRQGNNRDEEAAGLELGYRFRPEDSRIERYMNFEALAKNEFYIHEMVGGYRNQLVFQYYRREILKKAATMCRELSRATGKECAPLADMEEETEEDA